MSIFGNTAFRDKYRKTFILVILITGILSCSSKKEIEAFRAIGSLDSAGVRLEAYRNFINVYPKSDSTFTAIRQIMLLYMELKSEMDVTEFIIDQLYLRSDPDIRKLLYSQLFSQILADSVLPDQILSRDSSFRQIYSTPVATALMLFPYLHECFTADSILNKYSRQFANFILQSDFQNINELRQLSKTVLSFGDPDLLDLSSRFLIKAVASNAGAEPDSTKIQNYGELYALLAWNAYRQHNWIYTLNLISQATKYRNLDYQYGLILLGAAQTKTGELNNGWGHVLEGLIQNPDAEKQSPEIQEIYISLFREIRGTRDNPERFLNQYRKSHR